MNDILLVYLGCFVVSFFFVFLFLPYFRSYRALAYSYNAYKSMVQSVAYDYFHYKLLMKNLRSRFYMAILVCFNPSLEFFRCVHSRKLLEECIVIVNVAMKEEKGEIDESCETESDID